jgi:hypothetical protein
MVEQRISNRDPRPCIRAELKTGRGREKRPAAVVRRLFSPALATDSRALTCYTGRASRVLNPLLVETMSARVIVKQPRQR